MTELSLALSKAQSKFPVIIKNKTVDYTHNNKRTKYSYADLSGVIETIKQVLGENGLSFVQKLDFHSLGGGLCLETILMHSSGEQISSFYPLSDPKTMHPQEFGKSLTYARRYALSCILGVASEEDTDGDLSEEQKPKTEQKVIRQTSVHKEVEKQMRQQSPPDDFYSGDPGFGPEPDLNNYFGPSKSSGDYVVAFGKFEGRKLSDIKIEDLRGYMNYLKGLAVTSGKPLSGKALELVTKAEEFLN